MRLPQLKGGTPDQTKGTPGPKIFTLLYNENDGYYYNGYSSFCGDLTWEVAISKATLFKVDEGIDLPVIDWHHEAKTRVVEHHQKKADDEEREERIRKIKDQV